MGGGDSVQAPQPSAAELELRQQQAALAQQQREVIEETLRRQDLLNPILYEQQGIRPIYSDVPRPVARNIPAPQFSDIDYGYAGQWEANPNYMGASSADDNPSRLRRGNMSVADARAELNYLRNPIFQSRIARDFAGRLGPTGAANTSRISELEAFINASSQPSETAYDRRLTGYERLPASETDTMQAEITRLLQTRTLSALRGELPVDPALERNIAEQRMTLGETLRRNLGPGYEASSPGIEALSNFDKRAEELRYAARQDALSSGNAAQMGAQAFQQTLAQQRFGNIITLNNLPLTGASALGQAGSALSGPLAGYMADRQAQLQAAQANANQPDAFGQVLGLAGGVVGSMYGMPWLGAAASGAYNIASGGSPFAGSGYSSSISGLNTGGYDPWPGLTYR